MNNKLLSFLVCLWFVLACLSPEVRGASPVGFRLEDFVLFIMAFIVFIRYLASEKLGYVPRMFVIMSFLFLMLLCISFASQLLNSFFSSNLLSKGISPGSALDDMLKEMLRFFKYVMIALVFGLLNLDIWDRVMKVLIGCCLIIIAIQFMQYLLIPGVNAAISLIYGAGNEEFVNYAVEWARESGDFRAGSIFGNPNVLGVFLIAPFTLLSMMTLKSLVTKKAPLRISMYMVLICIIMMMGIFLAQSRSSFLACLTAIVASFLAVRKYIKFKSSTIIIGLSGVLVVVVVLMALFSSNMSRYSLDKMRSGFGGDSLGYKAEMTLDEINNLRSWEVVVGEGVGMSAMLDSELAYVIVWYGLLGLLVYFSFYIVLYREIKSRVCDAYIRSAFMGIVVGYVLGGIPNSCMLNVRVFPVFLALLSLAVTKKNESVVITDDCVPSVCAI